MPYSKLLSVTGWTGSGGSPRAPHILEGIGKQRFAHVGEGRTAVGAVFIGDGFYPKRTRTREDALTSGSVALLTRRPLVSSARPAARAAGETRSPPRAAPWPGQAWPRRRPSGARSRRSASCAPLREISAQHNRRF